jgi:hypothetical protein
LIFTVDIHRCYSLNAEKDIIEDTQFLPTKYDGGGVTRPGGSMAAGSWRPGA